MESYIYNNGVVLARGMKDGQNAPEGYVTALQEDLAEFGFSPGKIDGDFGKGTEKAVIRFQTEAKAPARALEGKPISIPAGEVFTGEAHGKVDAATRTEIDRWHSENWRRGPRELAAPPAWTPDTADASPEAAHGFDFAAISGAATYWPVRTENPNGRKVSFRDVAGGFHGNVGRRFCARRDEGARYHVGVDLWGDEGDVVVATEPGKIVNLYHFYRGTYAFFVRCDSGLVINYGEVAKNSWREFKLEVGSRVEAGKPIARVGKMHSSSMCHFETYVDGVTKNQRYVNNNKPAGLLNPSKYLLHLAAKGL